MKILSVNLGWFGSTGSIMRNISKAARIKGHTVKTACPNNRAYPNSAFPDKEIENITICSVPARKYSWILRQYTGYDGVFSIISTRRFLKKVKNFSPDIIHLHNIHSAYINYRLLFDYIKNNDVKLIWTLHDCWSFTGQCPHFTMAKCDKWKTGCFECPNHRYYPDTYVDRTQKMYNLKKEWFCGVKNMTIVTPSQWLADLVGQSFLKDYPVKVINNGIDLDIFKPTDSDIRKKYGCEDSFVLLGVAFDWGVKKGLDVFIELAEKLDDSYKIILVGTNDEIDKTLPKNIISIHRTQNQRELAQVYSAADLFVNPTREENYPTVNMEALACGTPVLTFRTGGSPEIIDRTCGSVVDCNDTVAMINEIVRISKDTPYSMKACLNRAMTFSMSDKFNEYIELYEQL